MSDYYPLTTMEEFLLWEDRPAYPWSCFARMRFSGRLDRAAFEAAVRIVLARHPLLTAKVEAGGRRRLRWSVVAEPAPAIRWETAPVGGPLPPAAHLDLRREIGIRFHVRRDAADSEVTLQFHHACCDGGGISQILRELLVAYALSYGPTPAETRLPPLDPRRLSGRGRFGLTPARLLRMAPQQLVGILGARQFLMRRPAPLIPHRACADDSPLPENYPATEHCLLDLDATARLRRAALRLGVTLNDLLARDFFLALAEWRVRQGIPDDGRWLRMMIPMSLRTTEDRLLPAANLVSSVFLDRRGPDFEDADRLLQGIHAEMDLIKRLGLGLTFVLSTAICRRLPGGLFRQVRADKCTISCIFTNVGKPFVHVPLPRDDHRIVTGNLTLEDLDAVAPLRPYSCVTLGLATYARRMGITLHYDPRPLSSAQAADLLETFTRRLRAVPSPAEKG